MAGAADERAGAGLELLTLELEFDELAGLLLTAELLLLELDDGVAAAGVGVRAGVEVALLRSVRAGVVARGASLRSTLGRAVFTLSRVLEALSEFILLGVLVRPLSVRVSLETREPFVRLSFEILLLLLRFSLRFTAFPLNVRLLSLSRISKSRLLVTFVLTLRLPKLRSG